MALEFTTHPVDARLFVQERAGKPWVWVGPVTVRNLQKDPVNIQYDRTVGPNGVEVDAIRRTADPTPFDVNMAGNFGKWQSLHAGLVAKGCKPNFLFVNAKCREAAKIQDPTHNGNGVFIYGVDVAGPYQIGNNTAITRDDQQTARREDALQFTSSSIEWYREMKFRRMGTVPVDADWLVVADEGECADGICGTVDRPGGSVIIAGLGGGATHRSLDGGATWAAIAGATAGVAGYMFNNRFFYLTATAVFLTSDPQSSFASWTGATNDVSFAGLTCAVQVDPRTILVGGADGQIWRSTDGGANFVRIANLTGLDVRAMTWNASLQVLVGVFGDTASPAEIRVSSNGGTSWTSIHTADAWGANSNAAAVSAGAYSYVVINGKLYKIGYAADGTVDATEITVPDASGNITGIATNGNSPNDIILTAGLGAATEKIFRTIDGFAQFVTAVALPFTPAAVSTINSPIVSVQTKYGRSLVAALGTDLIEARDWESFFVSL